MSVSIKPTAHSPRNDFSTDDPTKNDSGRNAVPKDCLECNKNFVKEVLKDLRSIERKKKKTLGRTEAVN